MKVKDFFSTYYIESNIHVGIAAGSLTAISVFEKESNTPMDYALFVFFATVLSYNFIRIFENANLSFTSFSERLREQDAVKLLCCLPFVFGFVYFALKIKSVHFILLLPSIFINFWYAVPLPFLSKKNASLRNHPKLKLFSIALVWAMVTVLFPLQNEITASQTWLLFIQRLLIITVLALPFDMRDMHKDDSQMQTLPQQIGILNTKKVGLILLLGFFILLFFKNPIHTSTILAELLIFSVSLILLAKSSDKQTEFYASFWVESIPIIWLFSLLFFQKVFI